MLSERKPEAGKVFVSACKRENYCDIYDCECRLKWFLSFDGKRKKTKTLTFVVVQRLHFIQILFFSSFENAKKTTIIFLPFFFERLLSVLLAIMGPFFVAFGFLVFLPLFVYFVLEKNYSLQSRISFQIRLRESLKFIQLGLAKLNLTF